jgi:N-acetylneuraminic acid mutarotase
LIDGKLYVFGGVHRTGSGQSAFHSFYECNLNLESSKEDLFKWKKIQVEAPKNRDSHSCVSFLEQLLIFGGSCNDKSFNDLYKYNITAKMWQKLDPIFDEGHLPSPREGHIAVMIEDDKMLVHGGINEKCEVFDDAFILVGLH